MVLCRKNWFGSLLDPLSGFVTFSVRDSAGPLEGLLQSILGNSGYAPVKSVVRIPCQGGVASSREKVSVTLQGDAKLNLFMKVRLSGSQCEQIDKDLHMFEKEVAMYNKIIPMLGKFQEESGKHVKFPINEMFPKFYGAGLINSELYLVFEDIITDTGRFVTAADQFHSEDQVEMCLEQLGAFHAVSYAYKTATGVSISETFPVLQDHLFHPSNKVKFAQNFFLGKFQQHLNLVDAVRIEVLDKNPTLTSKIHSTCSEDDIVRLLKASTHLMDLVHTDQIHPMEPAAVITHGDFHMWNVAFMDNKNVKFFDLQASRYCSGMTDVLQYLTQVTTSETRKKHLDQFLSSYHAGFNQSCEELGITETFFSKEFLLDKYKRISPWGLMFGLCFVLPRFVTNQESFKCVENMLAAETHQRNTKKIVENLDKSGPHILWTVQVLFDMIQEVKELGTLDLMESFRDE